MKKYILITGSSGLVGSEAVSFFYKKNFIPIGIDNNSRKLFFGKDGCTNWKKKELKKNFKNFIHYSTNITNYNKLEKIFKRYNKKITHIIHAAAQPSHDWAAKKPLVDFSINANGTLNMLDLTLKYCPKASFILVSTNKVYGDTPNSIKLIERENRFDVRTSNKFYQGIDENMKIDNSLHSLFGVSKSAADLLAQEYGKNLGLNIGIFRAGCITGASHSGVELHGFLNYLVKTNQNKKKYTIYGYKGKQVRDNIHSYDLINCFWHFFKNPKKGEVYNIGGGRKNSCSILEAMNLIEKKTKQKFNYSLSKKFRKGDHQWYITKNNKFKKDFPNWKIKYSLSKILDQIIKRNAKIK